MFVSDVRVLRRFAQKLASISPELDKLQNTQLEPSKKQGPEEAPRGMFGYGKSTDKYTNMVDDVTRKPGIMDHINTGVGHAVDAGKSLYNNATPANLGLAAAGAGVGGGALYGLVRMLQSEEERKKKTPVMAPALGAVAGGVALPALVAALSKASPAAKAAPEVA